jgi:hypothetical protein
MHWCGDIYPFPPALLCTFNAVLITRGDFVFPHKNNLCKLFNFGFHCLYEGVLRRIYNMFTCVLG